jgi:lipopolysaccharide export system protein LptA
MPLPIYHLRRLLATTALLLTVVVTGMYLYARYRTRDVRHQLPGKIGYDIKQTANGFQFSKSDGKRTLFSVQASRVKEFKLNGRAELHDVNIVLYGRDSSRYDQISGEDFTYDPNTGIVTAKGEVTIDLVANPAGTGSPDQSAPKELKNAIHLKTSGLIFNKETGDASTDAPVEFSTPQASGSAVGVRYAAKSNLLDLRSHIHVELTEEQNAVIDAESGTITNDPRRIVLEHSKLRRQDAVLSADHAVLDLGPDNNLELVDASGNVSAVAKGKNSGSGQSSEIHARADSAEMVLYGKQSLIRSTTLTGNVHVEQSGPQPIQADAGRLTLDFAAQNEIQTARATDGAILSQTALTSDGTASQNYQISAPTITFAVAQGRVLDHAETVGSAKIVITSSPMNAAPEASSMSPQQTVVTAGKFLAHFATDHGRTYLATLHGAPDARIDSSAPGEPDRISTSDMLDATFLPQGGIEAIIQQGHFLYSDNQSPDTRVQAQANKARYTPADQIIVLTGGPRVTGQAMETTAKTIRINRSTGQAVAETEVKSTYNEVKEQPNGALLASSSPIHVTAANMTVRNDPGIALYTGNVRLWQDTNVIEAPTIQFDRAHRFVTAQGTASRPVQTILTQPQKTASGKGSTATSQASSSIFITAGRLTYADADRKIHYEDGVVAKGPDFSASCGTLDAYLLPRGESSANQSLGGSGQLERMVAQGDVRVQQPTRRAEGQKLVYTSADDKFVLTGGPPSIFDAERGKITGVSLTFFRRDDRVLVEGEASTPVVTRTRVAP